MSPSEHQLVADVAAAPDDDAPRLVYADWLQDRGDPRGELIALMCELERGEAADERPLRMRPLREQVRQLIARHHGEWLGPLFEICAGYYELRRGFVEHVRVMQDDVPAERLRVVAPLLREASLPFEHPDALRPLLETFALVHLTVDARRMGLWLAPNVRRVDIARCTATTLAYTFSRSLEHVGLHFTPTEPLDDTAPLTRLFHRLGQGLRSLALGPVTSLAPQLLAPLAHLTKLQLTGHLREPTALAQAVPALTSLGLIHCGSPFEIAKLVAQLPALRHLRVVGSFVNDDSAHAIARGAPQLTRLDLSHNRVTLDGARRLLELLPELVELRLRDNALDEGALDGIRIEHADRLDVVV